MRSLSTAASNSITRSAIDRPIELTGKTSSTRSHGGAETVDRYLQTRSNEPLRQASPPSLAASQLIRFCAGALSPRLCVAINTRQKKKGRQCEAALADSSGTERFRQSEN